MDEMTKAESQAEMTWPDTVVNATVSRNNV